MMRRNNGAPHQMLEMLMNLVERLAEMTSGARDQAARLAAQASSTARGSISRAADAVEATSAPISRLADAGLQLNKLAFDYMTQVVGHQAQMLTGAVNDGAHRLRLLVKARSLPDAYAVQVEYFDVTRERLTQDANRALRIVTDAGRGVSKLASSTYSEFSRKAAPTTRALKATKRASARVKSTARKTRKRKAA